MIHHDPELPDTASLGGLAMRELERRGGRAGVTELHDAVRATLAVGFEPRHSWEREFHNDFGWAMRMLRILEEVERFPASESEPSGWYEALPRDPEATNAELERRREQWLKTAKPKWYDIPLP
jgi:hypothetical protein